ncbi:hypothetical protein QNO21_14700 [Microbacterium sp. zg-Y818]|uniref:hypothetical protein n=1 Tax=unclassified Microbacterium TaxID=2609290 RepID=UPI00214BA155|nr:MULTISPECIES: hypothetical protein [unclassified Microbacterium]MCR2800379.1 hypothetical protein [Microbacterium sp. zg.Y818]WIM22339.1 hypothetical protein QNO21_14700 [Microbacterium sp. zg-Y818]
MTRRRLLGPITALVTLAVLGGSGAAVAGWSADAALTATAASAAPATTIAQTGSLATSYQYTGSSSGAVSGQLTIANTGGTPLSYTLASDVTGSSALAQKTALNLWTGTCSTTVPASAIKTTLADPAPALPATARTLAPGAQVVVCVATRIDGSTNAALQGQSITAAFRVIGAVGTSWTATATTTAVTQSVYQLAAAGAVTCTNVKVVFDFVRLSWAAPANRPARADVTYEVVDTASGTTVATVKSSAGTASVLVEGKDLDANGVYSFAIRAKEAAYGTTAPLTAAVSVTRTSGPLGIISATECS